MEYIELKKYIEQEIEKLNNQLNIEDKKLNYLSKFFAENSLSNIDDIIKINYKEFFIAYLLTNDVNVSLSDLEKMYDDNQNIITEGIYEDIVEFLLYIEKLSNNRIIREVIELTKKTPKEESNSENIYYDLKKSSIFSRIKNKLEQKSKETIEQQMLKEMPLVALYLEDEDLFEIVFLMMFYIQKIKEDYYGFSRAAKEFEEEEGIHIRNKHKKQIEKEYIQDAYGEGIKKLFQEINIMKRNYNERYTKKRNEDKNTKKTIILYQNLLVNLENKLKEEEISNINNLLYKISDETIRLEILKLIYNHNIKGYKELEKKYNELDQNSVIKYSALLEEYNINENEYSLELIMKNSYNNLKTILQILKTMTILEPSIISEIIQETTIDRVMTIKELYDKNIVTKKIVKNHPELFSVNKTIYNVLENNIDILNEYKINPLSFNSQIEILFENEELIKQSIDTLAEYNLTTKISNEIDCSFIKQNDLVQKIDMILELGYEEYLIEDIELLNYEIDSWKRLQIIKILNIPIENKEELENVLKTTSFMVPDEIIDDYIYTINEIKENQTSNEVISKEIMEELNQNNNTTRTLKINDVFLSRNRIERNLKENEGNKIEINELMLAIIKNSILTEEDYTKITTEVYKKLTR